MHWKKRALQVMVMMVILVCSATMAKGERRSDAFRTQSEPVALFDGESLAGWHGLVGNPITRAAMSAEELGQARARSTANAREHWWAEDGELVNDGQGPHLCTDKAYRDFELRLDWKIAPGADSGIYLRGAPQVQIWDPVNGIDAAQVGSGGLYNNQTHRSTPTQVADRHAGTWNTFFIRMIGERVSVWLNGQLVVDDVVMENYWDRARPIFPSEQIELQTHGGEVRFRNLSIREIPPAEADAYLGASGWHPLFNGHDLAGWTGSVDGYTVEDGVLTCDPASGGVLLTSETYDDFHMRFDFLLPPGGNNGLAIRAPREGNPAYAGMELQILDNSDPQYQDLQPYQYHGSVYGVHGAQRGYLRPVGVWNHQEVVVKGTRVQVILNGTVINDVDLATIDTPADGQAHPGLTREDGHIGFMGHGDAVSFRNIWIRRLRSP